MHFTEEFRADMVQDGIICDASIIPDGKIHRFHIKGDTPGSNNGWYVLYSTNIPAGGYGCWKRDINEKWCSKPMAQMSSTEREKHNEQMQSIKNTAEAERIKAHAEAMLIARAKWDAAKPAPPEHPYLVKKGISPGVLRIDCDNVLLVPVYGSDKQLHSLQYINSHGKWFLTGGEIKGHYCPIGRPTEESSKIYIAEGYATGFTTHHATGCAVACALSSHNLLAVGQALRARFPEAELIFVADNDIWPKPDGRVDNVGLRKAKQAAEQLCASMVYPNFDGLNIKDKPTDFNDLMIMAGTDEVRRQLTPSLKEEELVTTNNEHIKTLPKLNDDAFFGIIQRFVHTSRVNSEASAVAVAANLITHFCAAIGRNVHQPLGDAIIECRPFFLLVGTSGKARKGTSEYLVRRVFARVYEIGKGDHKRLTIHGGGLSSGEGIIYALRDPSSDQSDPGVEDKRLLVVEPEFANVFSQCNRNTSILSPTIRNLFDGKTLSPLTKTNRIIATDPHVVIIGHITQDELHLKSGVLEATNGLLNRFLICAIERDQLMPSPKKTPDEKIDELAYELLEILTFVNDRISQSNGRLEISFTIEAEAYWEQIYPTLTEERPGLIGSLMGRHEMYTRMLAMIFCLMDMKTQISIKHLEHALAWIDYISSSIEYIFERHSEQPKSSEIHQLAERILGIVEQNGPMSRTAINNAFSGNVPAAKIDKALDQLYNAIPPVLRTRFEPTKGRPKEFIELCTTNKRNKGSV